ncbi:conserved protein of unknown function [Petrocella atlantisensis]|uniref:Uncharacterized protein n=1 Tax=Petrocella atlantisensis TaxID=2173034 RepID=A0A3P7S227_9FIRM|nr:hypothetical protein [Petrocella atlantisensis]MCF8018639.1 hypothetical protein [Vallitaleaceae bacterium]VDN48896.1 conserved protein of unknown function [Petrocella atlantisensis]
MNLKVITKKDMNNLKRSRKGIVDFLVVLIFVFLGGDLFMMAYTANNENIVVEPIHEDTIILPAKQGYSIINIEGEKGYFQDDHLIFIQENEKEGEVVLFHRDNGILDQFNYAGNITQVSMDENILHLVATQSQESEINKMDQVSSSEMVYSVMIDKDKMLKENIRSR